MKHLVYLFIIYTFFSCSSIDGPEPTEDINLIIPGVSGEGYKLGDKIKPGSSLQKKPDTAISEITGISFLSFIRFDSVLYNRDSSAIFLLNSEIVSIAGLKPAKRITSDAVPMDRGADNFILNYGNSDLQIISSGLHRAYIYRKLGIALFDDNNDNTIDMYLVFKK